MCTEVYIAEFLAGSRAYSSLELAQQSTNATEWTEVSAGWIWKGRRESDDYYYFIVKSIVDEYPAQDPAFRSEYHEDTNSL